MGLIKGTGAPTKATKGSVGDTYIDLNNNRSYKCVSAFHDSLGGEEYEWKYDEFVEIPKKEIEEDPEPVEPEVKQEVTQEPKEEPAVQNYERPKNNYHNQYNKQQYRPYNKPNRK